MRVTTAGESYSIYFPGVGSVEVITFWPEA